MSANPARLVFEVPGQPAAKLRPKAARRKKRGGATYIAQITPEKTIRYESDVALFGAQAMAGRPLLDGALWMHVSAFFTRPKSHAKMKEPPVYVTKKPDGSNVLKAIEDGLNGVAYLDDAIVADSRIVRRWCNDGRPRVVVSIGQLTD
jgi:Holliday junction resolvase RusA-like endonuclease